MSLSGMTSALGFSARATLRGWEATWDELLASSRAIRAAAREALQAGAGAGLGRDLPAAPPGAEAGAAYSVIERPLTKPSDCAIWATTASGTAPSVVMAITARSARAGSRPDRGGVDVDAVLAQAGADAADHAGDVGVLEQRQVRIVDLEVEALAPGLEQVRAVHVAERRADDLHALVAAWIVTRTRSL